MDEIRIKMNEILTILRRMDQNRASTFKWFKDAEQAIAHAEKKINETKEEINKMKKLLKVP